MNREQRRRAARANRSTRTVSESLCPDCNAETELVEIAPGLVVLGIAHDDTCPYLAANERTARP